MGLGCQMSRRPRFLLTDLPLHVVQRGNDRRPCFLRERDYDVYLGMLSEACAHYGMLIHAYVLMTNHVHLLVTPRVVGAVARTMQSLGARYVGYVNRSSSRSGTLWEGRYHACLVASDQHVLAACRYIDLNPVRARLVQRAEDYHWSSYRTLAGLRADPRVTPHPVLEQLGSPGGPAYARWCADGDCDAEIQALRKATAGELAFGSESFKAHMAATTSRATCAKVPGPPRKSTKAVC
jgi:putative transposase